MMSGGGDDDKNRGFEAAQNLGADLVGDLGKSYRSPPSAPFNQSLWTDMGAETRGLIGQGLGDSAAIRSGVPGAVARGDWLGGQNPFFEANLEKTRNNITSDVNSTFNSNGMFNSDLHARGLAEGLANAENTARMADFENEYGRMQQASAQVSGANAQGLGYANMLDANAQGQRQGEFDLYNRTLDPEHRRIQGYLGTLMGGQGAPGTEETQPWWQTLLGYGAQAAGGIAGTFF